jgi:serine/threonine-protein kinase
MDGFEHAKQQVTLKDDEAQKLRLELKKGSVVVELNVGPAGVSPTYLLDGKGVAGPRIEGVTSGVSHKLVVNAPGYVDQTVTFTGNALETKRLDVTLEKAPEKHATPARPATPSGPTQVSAPQPAGNGKLNVGASGGWCNVTVDGAPRGATPVAGVELSAGSHRVTCTTAEGKTQSTTVNVPADGTARYKFTL